MNEHDQLREQMWDLVYGLTTPEDTAALHARIKSDRTVARMYAEVRLEADLVAEAAKVEDTSIALPQLSPKPERVSAGRAKEASKSPASSGSAGWSLHWLGAIGASALAVLMAVGIFWRQEPSQQELASLIKIKASSDMPMIRGLSHQVTIETANAEGKPVATEVTAQIADKDGTPLYEQNVKTDEKGHGQMPVPGDAIDVGNTMRFYWAKTALPKQADAQHTNGAVPDAAVRLDDAEGLRELDRKTEPLLETRLPVQPEPVAAKTSFNKDWYAPGDVVQWRTYVLSAFTHQPQPVDSLEVRLVGPDGNSLQPEEVQTHPETGVVTGKFRLPAEAAAGRYALSVQDSARGEPQTEAVGRENAQLDTFYRQSIRVEGEETTELRRKESGRFDRAANLGQLAGTAGSSAIPAEPGRGENDAKARPAPAAKGPGGRTSGSPSPAVVPAAPQPEGAALLANAPAPVAAEDKSESAPALARSEVADVRGRLDAQQMAEQGLPLDDAKKLSEPASRKVTFAVPPQVAGKPLLVEARNHNLVVSKLELPAVEVRQKFTDAMNAESLSRSVTLSLPPQVDGEIDLYFYDNSTSLPHPVHAKRVLIDPRNDFEIQLAEVPEKYAPGQTVRFKVHVTERGRAAPNVALGFKVAPTLALTTADEMAAIDGLESSLSKKQGGDKSDLTLRDQMADAPAPGEAGGEEAKNMLRRRSAELGAARPKAPARDGADASPTPPSAAALGPEGATARGLKVDPANELREEAQSSGEGRFQRLGGSVEFTEAFGDTPTEPQPPAPPTLLASNEDSVQQVLVQREAAQAAQQAQWSWWRARIGRGLLLGGVLLLVLLGVAVFVQRPASARLWVPSLAVAAASFIVGFVWLLGQPRSEPQLLAKRDAEGTVSEAAPPRSAPAASGGVNALEPTDTDFGGAAGGMGGFGGGAPTPADRVATEPGADGRLPDRIGPVDDAPASADGSQPAPDAAKKEALSNDASGPESGKNQPTKLAAGLEIRGGVADVKDALDREKGLKVKEGPQLSKSLAEAIAPRSSRSKKTAEKDEKSETNSDLKQKRESLATKSAGGTLVLPGAAMRDFSRSLDEAEKLGGGSLWQPLLIADENGEAVIEFTMPDEPGDYNLVLDVHGPGRIGQFRKVIRSEAQPAAKPATQP